MKAYTFTNSDLYEILKMSTLEASYLNLLVDTINHTGTCLAEYLHTCFCDYVISYFPITESHLTTQDYDTVYALFDPAIVQFSLELFDVRVMSHCNSLRHMGLVEQLEMFSPNAPDEMVEVLSSLMDNQWATRSSKINLISAHGKLHDLLNVLSYLLQEVESRFLSLTEDDASSYVLFGIKNDTLVIFVH